MVGGLMHQLYFYSVAWKDFSSDDERSVTNMIVMAKVIMKDPVGVGSD